MPSGGSYLDNSGRNDVLGGGARLIPVTTPAGQYRGPQRGPRLDRGAGRGHRRALRHDRPGAPGGDGGQAAGRYLYCPEGSHMAMYDDQQTYFAGLTDFLLSLDAGAS
jgi:hypothetical protein